MSWLSHSWVAWGGLSAVVVAAIAILAVRRVSQLQHLSEVAFHPPTDWPSLSVVVPACNEEEHIEAALRSLLQSDYPDVEFIVVDDRSADETGRIIDRVASHDDRARAIHIDTIPEGWLGKVHALHRGYEAAGGDWILMTDADIEYSPDALRRCVAYAIENEADHLACLPQFRTSGFWHEVLALSYISLVLTGVHTESVEDPNTDDYMGVGAFNLVRRSILDSSDGLAPIRMELADDVGLGWLVQRHGGRTLLSFADDALDFEWYESAGGAIRGFEKNAFPALGQFSFTVGLLRGAAPSLLLLGLAASIFAPLPAIRWLGIGALALFVASHARVADLFDRPLLPALFVPVGLLMLTYAFFRSAFLCWRNQGIIWRGTTYSLDELRKGQVVEP